MRSPLESGTTILATTVEGAPLSIDVERDGHVAVITINRPEARNALDPEHDEALGAAVAAFEADDDLRVAVLTGAGDRVFSAGGDV